MLSFLPYSQEEKKHVHIEKSYQEPYDKDLLSPKFHKERREALRKLMPKGSAAVFFSNPVRNRSNDVNYEYHQDPNFYYLTGLREPHSMVIIFKDEVNINGEKVKEIAFVQPRDPETEVWDGKRLGAEGVSGYLGLDMVMENQQFNSFKIPEDQLPGGVFDIVLHDDARDNPRDPGDLYSLKKHFSEKMDRSKAELDRKQLSAWMAQLREVKHPEEIELMRKAIDITCTAQYELMKNVSENMAEYQTEAIVEYHFKYNGAEHAGFPSIHGSGENSCILHYTENRRPFTKNDLLVSDIGAEYHGYTADVTRTIPVNGKFSEEQKTIYNLVLKAQQAGIDVCKPGTVFWEPHQVAHEIIYNGLKELGIVETRKEVDKYFMHGTSHYLGLDVHDAGMYNPLAEGNVITVEPGIYIAEGSDCDEKWWNIGVRIEDDILITKGGNENLSDCVPRSIEEIEAIMKSE